MTCRWRWVRSRATADGERLVSIATEPGQELSYLYDFGDDWWHTLTLEGIRAADGENTFRVLGGAGCVHPRTAGTLRIPSPAAGVERPGRRGAPRRGRLARQGLLSRAVRTALTSRSNPQWGPDRSTSSRSS